MANGSQPVVHVKAGAFREYVKSNFEIAAQLFAAKPGANEWEDLKIAMWAWQHVHQMAPNQLLDAAHEHLSAIAEFSKGDRNFGEPT